MIRWVVINGRRLPAPQPPAPAAYRNGLLRMLRELESVYLEAMGAEPESREDSGLVRRLLGNRVALVRLLQKTDRARGLTQHNLSLMIDGVMEYFGQTELVDQFGRAIVRDANSGFDKLVKASAKPGQQLKASIYAINLKAGSSDMAPFLDGFRRKNTDLIKRLVGEQVVKTERVIANSYGEHVRVLRERIQAATGTTESHAELLARDQTLKANADIQRFRAQSVGANRYTWITSNDERVRGRPGGKWEDSDSNHFKLHGKQFEFNKPPLTNAKKGIHLNPGMDFQCRCTATPDLSHIFE